MQSIVVRHAPLRNDRVNYLRQEYSHGRKGLIDGLTETSIGLKNGCIPDFAIVAYCSSGMACLTSRFVQPPNATRSAYGTHTSVTI